MSSSTPARGLSPDAFSSIFQAINGLRNRRALTAMVGCLCAGVLVFGLCSFLAMRMGFFMTFVGGLALFVAGATGINATGVLLMDQAKGAPSRGAMDAVVDGLMCIPKFILLGLALFAIALAVWIAIALVFVACKIPVLGPILFVAVFPASVVISGLTLCGLMLSLFLALPAIWEGATVTRALAQVLTLARSRLVEATVLLAVVGVLSALVGFIVFGVLFAGLMPSIGMSASILGGDGLGHMLGSMRRGGEFGGMDGGVGMGGAGYAIAAGIGAGLLWAFAGSLVSLVNLLGLNLVYLRVTEGLDADAAEAALTSRLADAKRQAAELAQKTRDAAERVREQSRQSAAASAATQASAAAAAATAAATASPAAPSPAAPAPPRAAPREAPGDSTMPSMKKVLACPQCLSAIAAEDVFCGVCGYKLK